MYSNNIVNFQESTTILNTHTKKSGNLLYAPRNSTDSNPFDYNVMVTVKGETNKTPRNEILQFFLNRSIRIIMDRYYNENSMSLRVFLLI